ncbi:MAG: hypothetical protein VBE63_07825 [Lamprobacter sp.]|uniref:hypothetical protein n=1 Tax=Lamprobacter sp. TaxID=3100796 RepID=UPI002B25A7D8|nr:hypothetical protein [Lamprobacter sp.]MEA3639838.1 hypothetical protein [Lamprobacter sp.]
MNQDDKTPPVEQEQMLQPTQSRNANPDHQASRRRLLKAAAVAPVIYTLPSGSALAATSTSCLGNEGNIITGVTKEMEDVESCDNEGNCTTFSQETGRLKVGDQVFTPTGNPNEFNDGEQYYIKYDQETLVAGSCWNSINLSSTKSFSDFL